MKEKYVKQQIIELLDTLDEKRLLYLYKLIKNLFGS